MINLRQQNLDFPLKTLTISSLFLLCLCWNLEILRIQCDRSRRDLNFGIKIIPNGQNVTISLPKEDVERKEAGYALPRIQFDYMMFKRATELVIQNGGSVVQGTKVIEVLHQSEPKPHITGVVIEGGSVSSHSAPLVIGAGGWKCPVAKKKYKVRMAPTLITVSYTHLTLPTNREV